MNRPFKESLSLYWTLQKAALRAETGYRFNFVLLVVMGIVYQGSGIAFVWVILSQFDSIGSWTFSDVAFLYSLRLLAHAVWVVPFNQVYALDELVREGRFDVYLLRPLNPLLQVITGRMRMNILGDVITAVTMFGFALTAADVDWTPAKALYLVLAVLGGAAAEGAVVLLVSALSFRFLHTWSAHFLVDNVFLLFGSYPLHIFGTATTWILTWTVPVAFVAYVPASVLLGRTGDLSVSPVLAWAAPAIGFLWMYAAYRIWVRQMRHYQSTGT
ncbi:ABC transporter permease [Streptomyces katsurahamanus]|uniref:ABC transporter permease n=1 Tax=Streptomyces katsurahamanus TaxID=2577098 RepID=A0ABW9NUT6_9ACTN|nr:ABC-2 family transporter protein [Streptomyces katsurahamanus]MQS37071.1 ABC transporter permease [Streptomyces katsurahamanus]